MFANQFYKNVATPRESKKFHIQIEPDTGRSPESGLTLMWIDISGLSKGTQFACCCLGVFVCYLLYGFLLELIFTLDGLRPHGWYITLMQFGYYSLFGWIEKVLSKVRERKVPIKMYILLAGLTLGTVGFSNTSLLHLNYPTQVICKCCKLIPVMIGGILIQKKKFGVLDFLAAISMCAGLALFTLADIYISPKFDFIGLFLISLALICDAAIGNVQEKAMNSFNVTNAEVVFYSYSFGFLYLLAFMVASGKFFTGFYFCLQNPIETYGYGLLFAGSGFIGVQFVLTLVKTCGATTAATVTTCRKAVSIVLSFLFFRKPFTMAYFWSGLLVVLGIYLSVFAKKNRHITVRELCLRSFCRFARGKRQGGELIV